VAFILLPVALATAGIVVGVHPRQLESQILLLVLFELAVVLALLIDLGRRAGLARFHLPRMPSVAPIREIARQSFPIAAVAMLATAYTRLDVLVIAPLAGSVALGLYSYAYRVSEPFRFVASAIDSTLYSYLSSRSDHVPPGRLFAVVVSYALMFAGGAALSGWFLVRVLYVEYRPALPAVYILSTALCVRCLNGYFGAFLYAQGRFTAVLKIAICNTIFMALIIYPMVSTLGIVGAACSLLAVEMLNFLLQSRNVLEVSRQLEADPGLAR
jgi:O-antigen/teichoic acid export membrane protein